MMQFCTPTSPWSAAARFGAKIFAELQKDSPCKGVIRRDLLEMELGALERDRKSIETKLGLLLSSFAGSRPFAQQCLHISDGTVFLSLSDCRQE